MIAKKLLAVNHFTNSKKSKIFRIFPPFGAYNVIMEEKEIKFDIVILSNPFVKYSPLSFGTAFTNIHYLLDEKVSKSQKNLEEYFKIHGPIYDENGNAHEFTHITTFSNMGEEMYHINFK